MIKGIYNSKVKSFSKIKNFLDEDVYKNMDKGRANHLATHLKGNVSALNHYMETF